MAYFLFSDEGAAVRQVQEILRDRAYYLSGAALIPVDGIYGTNTRTAVQEFQTDFGLEPDGVVDLRTWVLLQGEGAVLTDFIHPTVASQLYPPVYEYVSSGLEDSYIRILQIMLSALGSNYGLSDGLAVTGQYDEPTRAAVVEFQEKAGFTPDGRLTLPVRRRIAEDYEKLLRDSK